jgi:glucosamine-phosphate N-acetyltransferase
MNKTDLNIRAAEYDDFENIFPLLEQLWSDLKLDFKTLFDIYKKGIDSESQRLIVGIVDNKTIGFCSLTIKNNLWQTGNLGHVDELVIDKSCRGKGYGKTLIDSITKIAKDLKCKRIELDSAFHRKEAHRFYESIGYENRAFLFSKTLK